MSDQLLPVGVQIPPRMISLPAEIDITNAHSIGDELAAAFLPDATVVADLSATTFCDCAGVSMLEGAHRQAAANHAQLRLVVRSPSVRRVFALLGADLRLAIYPDVGTALGPGPAPPLPPGCSRAGRPRAP